jgi:hypothetical protein
MAKVLSGPPFRIIFTLAFGEFTTQYGNVYIKLALSKKKLLASVVKNSV